MTTQHYHLYMDESGTFEGDGGRMRKERPLIAGLLVPEAERAALARDFERLRKRHGLQRFLHASEHLNDKNFHAFLQELAGLTVDSGCILFQMTHEEDIHAGLPASLDETFAANRYLNMAQALFEHLFFLHPPFFGLDLAVSLHPNSRVFLVRQDDTALVARIKALGFHTQPIDKGALLVFPWGPDVIRTALHRLALEYAPFQQTTGSRQWLAVEAPVAKWCADPKHSRYPGDEHCPFINWVDNLALLCRANRNTYLEKKFPDTVQKIAGRLDIDIAYGAEQQEFARIVRRFLAGDLAGFTGEAVEHLAGFSSPYHRRQTEILLERAAAGLTVRDIGQVDALERRVDTFLSTSRGNWAFVDALLDRLLAFLDQIGRTEGETARVRGLCFRVLGHKLRIHNHRGEYRQAWQIHRRMQAMDQDRGQRTLDEFRHHMEIANRMAVTAANVFAFEEGNRNLEPLEAVLEESRRLLGRAAGREIFDPLLGKIRGTMAQNHSFLARWQPERFSAAEALFQEAIAGFPDDDAKLRHRTYLLHLYLDWERMDAAAECMRAIHATPSFKAFCDAPSAGTARYMQFALHAVLKYHAEAGTDCAPILDTYTVGNLEQWFGSAANEHPFELIHATLGRLAAKSGDLRRARRHYQRGLGIPAAGRADDQPTIQVIRCQILARQALDEWAGGSKEEARNAMLRIRKIFERIGRAENLESILALPEGSEPSGWFAPAWNRLAGVDWKSRFDEEACRALLDCFTFNYW